MRAAGTGREARDFFSAAVYFQSPLQFGRAEAEHYVWFAERGYRVGIGLMLSSGGTGPATLAGALSLQLAELLCIHMLQRAVWGERRLDLYCSLTPLDMRRGMYPYGRPERPLAAVAMAQMARRYRASFAGHAGHADAKRPSCEAGAQKVLTALPLLMACGSAHISAGLLSVDEVFSPIQMILDEEATAALQRFARGFEITEETLAFDTTAQVGPGGCFTDTDHTLRHFRGEHWQPGLGSRDMRRAWQDAGSRTDVDLARERYRDVMSRPNTTTVLSSGQVSDRPETLDRKVSKGCESTGFEETCRSGERRGQETLAEHRRDEPPQPATANQRGDGTGPVGSGPPGGGRAGVAP